MIEKLERLQGRDIYENTALAKLNEVIDAVNELQESQNTYWTDIGEIKKELQTRAENVLEEKGYIKLDSDSLQKFLKAHPEYNNNGVIEIPKKEPADPYAEQRKWIGKVCEFWDNDDTQQLSYGVLTKIDTETGFGVQYCCNDEYDYDDCQPVKPDDDIIYKGE